MFPETWARIQMVVLLFARYFELLAWFAPGLVCSRLAER
jgi:hypothetical protein